MTRDAKQSLTALVVVSFVFGPLFLLPPIFEDVDLPHRLPLAGLGLSVAILAAQIIRRHRNPR